MRLQYQKIATLAATGFLIAVQALPALAWRGNDFAITDGAGEQLQIKHSLFGRNKTVVKDRLGDGFATQTGFFGTKTSEVGILGNRLQSHKGLLGNSETDASTLLGDRLVTKKGIFGRRKTAVDLSGTTHLVQSFFNKPKFPLPSPMGSQSMTPQMVPAAAPSGPDVNVNGEALKP
jgi:hypothetical protein